MHFLMALGISIGLWAVAILISLVIAVLFPIAIFLTIVLCVWFVIKMMKHQEGDDPDA